MTKQKWTKFGGLSLGLALMCLIFLLVTSSDARLGSVSGVLVWGVALGLIGLMVGIVGRGFAKP